MKKLKNKVFLVIFFILTMFLVSILIIFNTQNYHQKISEIRNTLTRMDDIPIRLPNVPKNDELIRDDYEQRIFMDATIYTIRFDNRFNVLNVINHTTDEISEEKIIKIAEEILGRKRIVNLSVGNLYFDDYSYSFNKNFNTLTILDNSNARDELIQLLKTSFLIFIILEIAIIIISRKITEWIIRPVIESFDKQKQFIADASHELKTPLSVIIASSEALESDPNEKKWLSNIKSESEKMSNLVTDLLDMAKSENNVKENYTKENLSKLIEKSVLTFEGIVYEKNIKLEYKIEENIEFLCNGNQINQLIGILLDNAVKHSEEERRNKSRIKKRKRLYTIRCN